MACGKEGGPLLALLSCDYISLSYEDQQAQPRFHQPAMYCCKWSPFSDGQCLSYAGSGTTVHPTKSTTPFTASVKAEHQVHSATTTKPLHTSFPTQRPGTAPSLLVLQPLQGISQPALAMNQTGTAARAGCADDSTTPASVPAGTAISTQYKPVPYEASITNPDPFPAAFDHVSAPEVQPAGRTSTPQIPQRRAAQTANQRIRQQLQPPNEDVARGASNMHSNEPMAANQFKMPIGAGGAGGGGDTAEMSKLSEQKTQGKRVSNSRM